jgi:hypothetical protein
MSTRAGQRVLASACHRAAAACSHPGRRPRGEASPTAMAPARVAVGELLFLHALHRTSPHCWAPKLRCPTVAHAEGFWCPVPSHPVRSTAPLPAAKNAENDRAICV